MGFMGGLIEVLFFWERHRWVMEANLIYRPGLREELGVNGSPGERNADPRE
jgi:hypothetical protein